MSQLQLFTMPEGERSHCRLMLRSIFITVRSVRQYTRLSWICDLNVYSEYQDNELCVTFARLVRMD